MRLEKIQAEYLNELPSVDGVKSPWYNMPAGQEHYRLLRHIGQYYKSIIDIGTYQGFSAYALSESGLQVHTWDVTEHALEIKLPSNVRRWYGNCIYDNPRQLLESDFILLDVDHSGTFERKLIDFLISHEWKGTMILDDIHLDGSGMPRLWDWIKLEKYDISHLGHHSGTGLVYF